LNIMAQAKRQNAAETASPASEGGDGVQGGEKQSAADFILAQPRDIAPAEVVARGKAAGIKFTASWVGKTRRAADESGGPASGARRKPGRPPGKKSTSAAKPRGKATKVTTPRGKSRGASKKSAAEKAPGKPATQPFEGSKKDFVLGAPPDMKPTDVVALAKKSGIEISANYVSGIRSIAKKNAGAPKRGPGRPRKTEATPAAAPAAAPKRRGRPPKSATAAAAVTELAPAPRKLGRPRKVSVESSPAASEQSGSASDEALVFDLVLRLGLVRSELLFGRVIERLKGMRFGD
jgi:hypothetical protein